MTMMNTEKATAASTCTALDHLTRIVIHYKDMLCGPPQHGRRRQHDNLQTFVEWTFQVDRLHWRSLCFPYRVFVLRAEFGAYNAFLFRSNLFRRRNDGRATAENSAWCCSLVLLLSFQVCIVSLDSANKQKQ